MPFYLIFVNFSAAVGEETQVSLMFRIGQLYGHLPIIGKSMCFCGCIRKRHALLRNMVQFELQFKLDREFNHLLDFPIFYGSVDDIVSNVFPDSIVMNRNTFAYHATPVKFNLLFDNIQSKFSTWHLQKQSTHRIHRIPIQIGDDQASIVNEWQIAHQKTLRKSPRSLYSQ